MENFTCTLEKKCSQLGCGKGGREHTWVGCQAGQGGTKEAGVGGLLLLLLMSSAVITRFHGLPMGEPATVRFVCVLFIFMCCCCCCCFRSVCVCLCFFFFGTFTLILSPRRRCGSVRFVLGALNITLCFRREISGICLCHFWKFGLRQMERSISVSLLSLSLSSFRFVDVNININSWKLNWSRLFRVENSPSLVAIKVSCPRFELGLTL